MTFEAYKERMRIFGQDHGFELGSEFEAIVTMEQAEGYVQRWLFRVVSTLPAYGCEEECEKAFQCIHGLFNVSSGLINLDNPIFYQGALVDITFLDGFVLWLTRYLEQGSFSYAIESNFIEYFLVVFQLDPERFDGLHSVVFL